MRSGASLRVLRGRPTARELAAVILAVDLATAAEHAPPVPKPSPWRTAARIEGVGGTPVTAAADLEAARRRPPVRPP
jgi:acyl-CoA carboxylase epsilon subunit-like protein